MRLSKSLKILSLILLISNLAACASVEERIVLRTKYVAQTIPLQQHPKAVNLHDVEFHAVTKENMEDFLSKFEKLHGDVVFFAISVPDYENMSMNVAELRRYINQQKAIIVYYENSIDSLGDNIPSDTEEVIQEGTITTLKDRVGLD